jgi:predicted NBD/HSP70 family sugar kinase
VTSAKPSLSLLREISDEAVLRALMNDPRLTRAEISVVTHLSKPTASESIRRLESAGLVHDTGQRTSGRGGVGRYYALASDVGVALAVSVAPGGIIVERVDPSGAVTARHVEPVGRPASPKAVARLLTKAARAVLTDLDASTVRVAVVSAADPVDRATGALVHLPDAPFLLGALTPARTLAPLVDGPVIVDNDVNWEARAERAIRANDPRTNVDDFVYLHLGEGLGCAVVADGEVRRGHGGLAGEIAHVLTTGTDRRAIAFTTVFEQLGLRHTGSTAIDVDALNAAVAGPDRATVITALATAIGDVITAAIGFCNPQLVVVGGDWVATTPVFDAVRARLSNLPRAVPVDLPQTSQNSALDGARSAAVDYLRTDIVNRGRN